MIQYINCGTEYIVSCSPQSRAHRDLLPHEDPGKEGVEGHITQKSTLHKKEPSSYKGGVFRHLRYLVVEGHGGP